MRKLRHPKTRMITSASALLVLGLLPLGGAITANASTTTSGGFETFTTADVNGQQGWQKTGPYDVAIANPTDFGVTDMGTRALRMSNAVVSGSFSDQTFSASLADEAGETSAENGGMSGGTRQRVFSATFAVRTTSAVEQPGLYASISPDRGDGARMSYLRLEDQFDGVHVFFDDYRQSINDFREKDVATLSRGAKHTLGLSMLFLEGPANDVVRVSVDGSVVHTGTSWEDYFRDLEGNPTRTVDSLMFREGGSAAPLPSLAGQGFLVDDVVLTSSGGPCVFITTGTTMTLQADCTTDHTITVPVGFTLDGAGHVITAVDTTAAPFAGAVVANTDGFSANVTNVEISGTGINAGCIGGLMGILLDHAAGTISDVNVHGIRRGPNSGCQEGNAIVVRNLNPDNTPASQAFAVTITNNTVSDYQKNGITIKGGVSGTVTRNIVTANGPITYIAQNGIQVSYGATARVGDNTISDNFYSPKSYVACGLLIYQADGVKLGKNAFSGNEKNLCNISRGGGAFGGL